MLKIATLRIYSGLPLPVEETVEFLSALDFAYSNLRTLETFILDIEGSGGSESRPPYFYFDGPNATLDTEYFLQPADRLVLSGASFNSEGFWKVLGSLVPLEQIRKYLNDRHERKKDLNYRNELERRRLELENDRLQTENLDKQVDVLRKVGYSERAIRKLLNSHYHKPLARLGRATDQGFINAAEIEGQTEKPKKI